MCSGSLSHKMRTWQYTESYCTLITHGVVAHIRVVCSVEELRRCWCVQVCRSNMFSGFDVVVNCAISSNKLLTLLGELMEFWKSLSSICHPLNVFYQKPLHRCAAHFTESLLSSIPVSLDVFFDFYFFNIWSLMNFLAFLWNTYVYM